VSERQPVVGLDARRASLWPQTGIARYIRNLLRCLEADPPSGLEVRPIDVAGSEAWERPIYVGRGRPATARALQEQVLMYGASRRLDALHLPWSEGPAVPACPFVITLHDLAIIDRPSSYQWAFRSYYVNLARVHVRHAARIIVDSEATLEQAQKRWGELAYRLIPLGVDPAFAYSGESHRTPLPSVLYTGGYDPRKRILDLIEAICTVARVMPDLELLVSGDPPLPLRQRMTHRLGSRVRFLGYLSDVELASWYRQAWVVAYPTDLEGFGFPIVEAFASGTPIVATDAGSVAEVLGNGGLLVEPGDVPALADGIRRVIEDRSLHSALRSAGLRRARKFDWARTARQTVDVYRELIG
jgi:glycosyltransferase involved in cell wall biosynthesis